MRGETLILQLGESQSSQLETFLGPATHQVEADLLSSLWVLLYSLGRLGCYRGVFLDLHSIGWPRSHEVRLFPSTRFSHTI